MGNIIQVPIRFEFHFVDKERHERVSTTLKIRRLRRLRDALKIGLDSCKVPEGSWRVSSFSALPLKLVDALERIRCAGVLVVYAEPADEGTANGVDLSLLSSTVTFDVRLNEMQVARYDIRVPSSTTIVNALAAFVRAHSCCSNDFEVRSIQCNGKLVSGCDLVKDHAIYTVELKATETIASAEGNFIINLSFVQDDDNREFQLEFAPNSIVSHLKERLKFIRIDHVCFVDQQFGALAMVEDTAQLVPNAKYMIDAESAANQNLVEPLQEEFRKLAVKPDILTPANAGMILRRNAYGLQMQMGSLYDARAGKFTSIHFPVDILMNQLGRQKFGNVQLRSTVSPADPWTLIDKCGFWEGSVDCFGVKCNEDLDSDRMFYFVYERKTGVLSMDVEPKFYQSIDIGTNTHVLNGAVMGIYFVISLYFEPTDVEFERAAVLQELKEQLSVPHPSERPELSETLKLLEPSIRICLYAPEMLNLATPFTLKGCRELIDNFKVGIGQEVQLEHWFLPLHQILPLERLKPVNILAYETAGA